MTTKQNVAKVLSIYELMQKFPDEQSVIDYLMTIFWAEGTVCPYCHSKNVKVRTKRNLYHCNDCLKDFTIRVGTIFERSHIPLHKWILAMYLIVTSRKGISSVQLSKELGITQKSAWFLLQRIRVACGNQTEKILSGIVEIDETYLGGVEKNKHEDKKRNQGRGPTGKVPVVGMKDRNGKVVAQVVTSTDKDTLHEIVNNTVVQGATVCTDEHPSDNGLDAQFEHKTVNHSAKQFVDGMAHTNGIESVWALLKRGSYGTYHFFSKKHISFYIDEFVFRFNEGNCKIDTVDRLGALVKGMINKRLTYNILTHGSAGC